MFCPHSEEKISRRPGHRHQISAREVHPIVASFFSFDSDLIGKTTSYTSAKCGWTVHCSVAVQGWSGDALFLGQAASVWVHLVNSESIIHTFINQCVTYVGSFLAPVLL